jgi:mycothiol system anti-sigma-R factor
MNKIVCFVDEAELNLFLDGELAAARQAALGEHIELCFECSAKYSAARGLKDMMCRACGNAKAPAFLRERIMSQIESAPAGRASGFREAVKNILIVRPLLPIGMAVALVAALFSVVLLRPSSSGAMRLVSEMVHEHDEYIEGFITDKGIQSADPQEVRKWMAVNSEMKIDLAQCDKFPSLVGACEIENLGRDVTCLFFDQGEKRVSLFMMRAGAADTPPGRPMKVKDKSLYCGSYTGSNYVLWSEGGVIWIMVSRLPEETLIRLAENLI